MGQILSAATTLTKDDVVMILEQGDINLQGRFVLGSNYTFFVQLEYSGKSIDAVYKPMRGERPLWDFPPETLAAREMAAFLFSDALGWELVPPTVMRSEGPFGKGSMQLYIPHNPKLNYFSLDYTTRENLKQCALFDLVINNADRKGSHIILDESNHIWLIDHGLCFHTEEKNRTVIWDFGGKQIPEEDITDLKAMLNHLKPKTDLLTKLSGLLNPLEIAALKTRLVFIINHPVFPLPDEKKCQFPWPLI